MRHRLMDGILRNRQTSLLVFQVNNVLSFNMRLASIIRCYNTLLFRKQVATG